MDRRSRVYMALKENVNLSPVLSTLMVLLLLTSSTLNVQLISVIAQDNNNASNASEQNTKMLPKMRDNSLKVEVVAVGLSNPTSMSFIDKNNMLVTEKNGTISLVTIGSLHAKPVANLLVDKGGEHGLLGIATINEDYNNNTAQLIRKSTTTKNDNKTSVFVYATQTVGLKAQYRNRVYAFHWSNGTLVDKHPILDLPGGPYLLNVGGKLAIGPDKHLYTIIGDLSSQRGLLQNEKAGQIQPDNSSVIVRVNLDGTPSKSNPFSNNNISTMHYYYGYGIRNGFGLVFDPVTGTLWDTENGPDHFDEINIVKPGFNSGWAKVMGPISKSNMHERDLVNFQGSHYTDPVFSWYPEVAPTGIEFLKSSKLGSKYTNNLFVGSYNNSTLYYFELNQSRTGLKFGNIQTGNFVADNQAKLNRIIFGTDFDRITDIKTGPDGYLYVLSYEGGKIFRIVPRINNIPH